MPLQQSKKHYTRAQTSATFDNLTDYHLQILVFLMRHRLARTSHIHMFMGGELDYLRRSMRLLFDLDPPLVMRRKEPYIKGQRVEGSHSKIHEPTELGLSAATTYLGIPEQSADNPIRTDHALLRTAFLAPLEGACFEDTYRYIDATEIIAVQPKNRRTNPNPYSWELFVNKQNHVLVPDKIFILEHPRPHTGTTKRGLFFLEIDTGGRGHKSEPIERSDLRQSSIAKKILLYGLTYVRKIHAKHFRVDNFRVLIITRGSDRIDHMIEVVKRYSAIHGFPPSIFHFTEHQDFTPDTILTMPWRVYRRKRIQDIVAEGEVARTLID